MTSCTPKLSQSVSVPVPGQMAQSGSRSRGTRSLAQSPQLNEDLWTKIGQHMTIKEWAKAAGACPAAWSAQCMWSMDIMADLSVAGTFRCHEYSYKALQCILRVSKTCTRDRKRQQKALPVMPNMVSCALHRPQPSGVKLLKCPCRMAVPVQEMLKEFCSSSGPLTTECREPTQSPQWRGPAFGAACLA